jgi:uncharacterized protein
MYPNTEEAALVKAVEQLMIDVMARYDPSHDAYHVQRVRKTALAIASRVTSSICQPDLLVVEIAALLHDVLDKKYVTVEQAQDPYAYFLPFFTKHATPGLDLVADGRAKIISEVVTNVSWTNETKLRKLGQWGDWHQSCVELHCVQDADRLDAIGAFGVLRCAAYNSAVNHPLHTPDDDPARPSSAIQHFHDKLVHIKDRLKTKPGRELGERRHEVLCNFLTSVQEEFDITFPPEN